MSSEYERDTERIRQLPAYEKFKGLLDGELRCPFCKSDSFKLVIAHSSLLVPAEKVFQSRDDDIQLFCYECLEEIRSEDVQAARGFF